VVGQAIRLSCRIPEPVFAGAASKNGVSGKDAIGASTIPPIKNDQISQNQKGLSPAPTRNHPKLPETASSKQSDHRAIKKILPFNPNNLSRHPSCLPKAACYPSDRSSP
jgi:hypothetical protein